MPVFINEVIVEATDPAASERADTVAAAGGDEQEEQMLRLLDIKQERRARLLVD